MATASGNVTTSLDGKTLTYHDTGSYGAIVSRILNIYDANGILLQTYNMGDNLTQDYTITADAYFSFVCSVVDNAGGPYVTTVNIVAQGIYTASYLARMVAFGCTCCGNFENIDAAEDFLKTANLFLLVGNATAAQSNIVAANAYINI